MTGTIFTPESARAALESIRPHAEAMRRLVRVMRVMAPRTPLADQRVDPDYFNFFRLLCDAMERVHVTGARVKDPAEGLVDFPARRAGKDVLLCWKVDEPSVAFWHDPGAGFAGRVPVDEDGPWEEVTGAA